MIRPSARLPLPDIIIDSAGTLRSASFGDVYFSRAGGIAETEHVFLAGNGLPARWVNKTRFAIGELGFGAGLNFLVTWQKFLETAPPSHRLHYLSFEQFPLTSDMLRQVHQGNALAEQLIAQYPLRLPGFHRLHFGRITLTLAFGDARELLPQLTSGNIDAWFLDGFAPAKNPELWGEDVLHEVARLSAPDASFATYSAAAAVRRGLEAQGFTVKKVKGFASKRDMLVGAFGAGGACKRAPATLEHDIGHVQAPRSPSAPARADALRTASAGTVTRIIVIGGGVAGCTVARTLAERGIEVMLIERGAIADGASGNEAAILYPQLTKEWRAATAWHFAGYGFMLRQLRCWREQGMTFSHESPGMVKLAQSEDEIARLSGINERLGLDPSIAEWLERNELSKRAGFDLPGGGIWFPHGTWLNPAELCRALVRHPKITLREHASIETLARESEGWRATSAQGEIFAAPTIVLCMAQEVKRFMPGLPLGISAGQISLLPSHSVRQPLPVILCHKGYVIPQRDHYLLGATYDHHDFSGAVTEENHARNLAELENALPKWVTQQRIAGGRTSLRATTPDRLPYVGEIEEGLYVSTGHGSRGTISAPLAAEILAAEICGELVPLTQELRKAISPARHQTTSNSVAANPSRAKIGA